MKVKKASSGSKQSGKSSGKKTVSAFQSMTGFGRSQQENKEVIVTVEIRSVNSRFLDLNCKLPREYSQFEPDLRESISNSVSRGRVDLFINRALKPGSAALTFNKPLFKAYHELYLDCARSVKIKDLPAFAEQAVCSILERKELFEQPAELFQQKEEQLLKSAMSAALNDFLKMRHVEGGKLLADLDRRFSEIVQVTAKIRKLTAGLTQELQKKLKERIKVLLQDVAIDQSRLLTEAAYLADRADISEELVRLDSHADHWKSIVRSPGQGRKLEFLLQEFGREFNTIGSKAQKSQVHTLVVEAKAILEKMREQLANVE